MELDQLIEFLQDKVEDDLRFATKKNAEINDRNRRWCGFSPILGSDGKPRSKPPFHEMTDREKLNELFERILRIEQLLSPSIPSEPQKYEPNLYLDAAKAVAD